MGSFNGIQSEIIKQADCLLRWAQGNNLFFTDHYWDRLDKFDTPTREHKVYLDTIHKRVTKCTKPGKFGEGHGSAGRYGNHCPATPFFYLRRIDLTNQFFRTDLRFEGVALGEPEFGNDKSHLPYTVSSQKFIEASNNQPRHPSEEEIKKYMIRLGFSLLENCETCWIRQSDGIVITDTREDNFINSAEGIVPVDLIISKI